MTKAIAVAPRVLEKRLITHVTLKHLDTPMGSVALFFEKRLLV